MTRTRARGHAHHRTLPRAVAAGCRPDAGPAAKLDVEPFGEAFDKLNAALHARFAAASLRAAVDR